MKTVQDVKDTIFWKQFTTMWKYNFYFGWLFKMSKIQFFESNSQLPPCAPNYIHYCSRCQRYNFLKAIHNGRPRRETRHATVQDVKDTIFWKQFTTNGSVGIYNIQLFKMSKIQFFESNSQLWVLANQSVNNCSRCQRYNFLKAIHNWNWHCQNTVLTVQDVKDTIFWKQFTTYNPLLFFFDFV